MENNVIDIRRQVREIKKSWWLFALSFVFFMSLAAIYWNSHTPQYELQASMLIEGEDASGAGIKQGGGMAQMMRTFSVGGFGGATVDNEIQLIASHDVMLRTVKALSLNRTYIKKTGLMSKEVLYNNSPINVEAPAEFFDTLSVSFRLKIEINKGKADVKITEGFFPKTVLELRQVVLPREVKTKYGKLQLLRTAAMKPDEHCTIVANISGNESMADYFGKQISIDLSDKKSDAITLSIKEGNKERGKAILNTIMEMYNSKRIERKNQKARQEYEFYTARIDALLGELSSSEEKMSKFKQNRQILNPVLEQKEYLKYLAEGKNEAVKARTEVLVHQMVIDHLRKEQNGKDQMIPIFDGLSDKVANPTLITYNELIAKRQELERSAKPNNSVLQALNLQIKEAKDAIIRNAQRAIMAAQTKAEGIDSQTSEIQGRVSELPEYERQYTSLMRDNELKNELYVFLLQKKENSLLNLTSRVNPSFIFDPAYSSIKPTMTKPLFMFVLCFLLAFLCPLIVVLTIMRIRNRIKNTYDLPWEWSQIAIDTRQHKDNGLAAIRSHIMSDTIVEQIFVYHLGHGVGTLIASDIATAFNATDRAVKMVKIKTVEEIFQEQEHKPGRYEIFELSDDIEMEGITHLLTHPETILLVTVDRKGLTRKEFKQAVAGIDVEHIKHLAILI